jgi:tetratricopeptide (TPR) repeat protein
LSEKVTVSDFAIEKALGELDKFSFIRLTAETVSIHPLLQAVEQDSLGEEERERWLVWACRLFNAFAPASPDDVRTWGVWVPLSIHAGTLLGHAKYQGIDALPIAFMANQLGKFLYARAAYAQAESFYEQALAIQEKALGPNHPDVGASLSNMASLYCAQGRYDEAEPLYEQALAIQEKALGPNHSDVGAILSSLASLYRAKGQYHEAERLFEQALMIQIKTLGPNHLNVGASLKNWGVPDVAGQARVLVIES